MKKYILLTFSILRVVGFAQDTTAVLKRWGLELGRQAVFVKDLYRSPYLYRGFNTTVELSFVRKSLSTVHALDAAYASGYVKSSFSPKASSIATSLNYQLLGKVLVTPQQSLYTGALCTFQAWRVEYFPDMVVPSYARIQTYMLSLSIGPSFHYQYVISKRSHITLQVSMPLINYVERPRFMDGLVHNNLGMVNLWNPSIKLAYTRRISSKFNIGLGYKYSYLQYAQPKAVRMLHNGLSIQLGF